MSGQYDVVVLGAGSGGLVAATTARRLGAAVALIEKHKVGGECLHTGCVPSKTLIHAAKVYHEMRRAGRYGLPEATGELEFSRVMEHVDTVVQGIYRHENPDVFREMGIDVHVAAPRFVAPDALEVGGEPVRFESALLCTGSSPLVPPIEGLDGVAYLTNETFWEIRELPPSVAMLGGGPISVELGQALARLGARVTIVQRNTRLLPREEEEISAALAGVLEAEGITCLTGVRVQGVQRSGTGVCLACEVGGSPRDLDVSALFVGTGRLPNVEGLDLERAGIAYTSRGIEVDATLRTSNPNVYACGDVTGPYRFTHAAAYQAEVAVRNALGGKGGEQDLAVVPWVTFTDPECARVGLTEAEARERHGEVEVLRVSADSLDRPRTEGKATGFLKIVLDRDDRILGASALAERSGEFVHEIALAMKHGLGIESIGGLIHAYPTYSEMVKKAAARYLRTKA